MRIIAILLVLLVLLGYRSWNSSVFEKVDLQYADGFLSAETDETYFEFDAKGSLQTEEFRVVHMESTKDLVTKMGFSHAAGVLSETDYVEFQRIVDSGRCPASFLNSHAKTMVFATVNPEVKALLKRVAFGVGTNLRATYLPLTYTFGEFKGQKLNDLKMGRTEMVLVQKLEVD